MTDTITPALKPSEWAEEFDRSGENEHEPRDNGDVAFRSDGAVRTGLPRALYERHIGTLDGALLTHALAAVFLYGQPFGFTEEDVFVLRMVVQNAWLRVFEEGEVANARLTSLADRIAALLPPTDHL